VVTIEVNKRPIKAKAGEMLLAALKRAGIDVPTLCHMENLFPSGACRLCVVEVEGQRNLVTSCAFPVFEGMKVQTHSPRAVRARKTIIELLLANHPDDCLYCLRSHVCKLRNLAQSLGIQQRRFVNIKPEHRLDTSSPSIVRDQAKCILCGKCIRVCEEIQGVGAIDFQGRGSRACIGTTFDQGLNVSSCVNCGQCVMACPTGALRGQLQIPEVANAIDDPEKLVVVQHAPSVSVTLAEEFGLKPGTDIAGVMTAALRKLGFDRVFDTSFAADLTVMEEAAELVNRIKTGGPMPLLTSCSPGWVKFVEQFFPDFIPNLSTCKSPQQMMGAIIKSHFAKQIGRDPSTIYSVSIMPCTAKKFEAERPEMAPNGLPDVDAVLTTRELARMIRMRGLDLATLEPEQGDTPFNERSSAGKLFGSSGGVAEAAIRTAHWMVTGQDMAHPTLTGLRGPKGIKEAKIRIGDLELNAAVVSGLGNARRVLEEIRAGWRKVDFIEVMTCPGGCVAGGGQPVHTDAEAIATRMRALHRIDRDDDLRMAHRNESVDRLYREFLGKPNGEMSHHLLHTHYTPREMVT
jgi:iron-only hydrogenase group A